MPIYPGSMRSCAPPLGSLGPQWIEGVPTSYLDLVVTSSQSQWQCSQLTVLWEDPRKECSFHLTTSAVGTDPLRKRRLLSAFFVNAHLLRNTDIGYLVIRSLSCSTELSSIDVNITASSLSSFRAGFPAWDSRALNVQPLRYSTSSYFGLEKLRRYRSCVHLWRHNGSCCVPK